MRIQHNIPAMNAYGNYNKNTKALQLNLQKLSSGYKINKAGDDAAGLAISEKMRAQITGLEVAQKNAKDGISLVQTAEGALQEVHTMLNRMYSLAEQSANGTYQNDVDREQLQKEVQSLRDEIDRIADSTNFNGQKLLDGKLTSGGGAKSGKDLGNTTDLTFGNGAQQEASLTITAAGALAANTDYNVELTFMDKDGNVQTVSGSAKSGATANVNAVATLINGAVGSKVGDGYTASVATDTFKITQDDNAASQLHIVGLSITKKGDSIPDSGITWTDAVTAGKSDYAALTLTGVDTSKDAGTATNCFTIDGKTFEIATRGKEVAAGNNAIYVDKSSGAPTDKDSVTQIISQLKAYGVSVQTDAAGTAVQILEGDGKSSGGLTLQIGDTSDSYNKMTVSIDDMHAAAMGIGSIDIGTENGASAAMTAIKDAINYVSNTRGTLGSLQNRLDHTINNLSVQQENIQDAEATIRDVDVANEMMAYTKNNILVQSAQAMLAQANQLPQGVLQLLG